MNLGITEVPMVLAWFVWLALTLVSASLTFSWIRARRELLAPYPILIATIAFYFLPRAAYLLWSGRAPLTSGGLLPEERHALIAKTLILAVCALLAFSIGHASRSAARLGRALPLNLPVPDRQRAVWISVLFGLAGAFALVHLLVALGSIDFAIANQHRIGILLGGREPIFELTRALLVPVGLLLVDEKTGKSRWWVWLYAAIVLLAQFPLGRRSHLLLAAIYPLGVYHLVVRRIRLRVLVPAALLGALGLFAMSYTRLLGIGRVGRASHVFLSQPTRGIDFVFNASGELQIFDAATIIARDVPETVPYNYGITVLRAPWWVIPRRLWSDKPITMGQWLTARYLPKIRAGYPPMAIGDLYAALGVPAIVIGFVALGWIARVGWEWHSSHPGSGNAVVYLGFCFFIYDFARVGDFSRTLWFLLVNLALFTAAFAAADPKLSNPR